MEEKNPIVLDRTTYKRIKSMDRKQMEVCLTNIYNSGISDAAEAGSTAGSVSIDDIKTAISGIKGIGEARLNDIMDAVAKLYNTEVKEEATV